MSERVMFFEGFVIYMLAVGAYMLPTLIAMGRGVPVFPVLFLNIFLGFSGVGWVLAFCLACSSVPARVAAYAEHEFLRNAVAEGVSNALRSGPRRPAYGPPPQPGAHRGLPPGYTAGRREPIPPAWGDSST